MSVEKRTDHESQLRTDDSLDRLPGLSSEAPRSQCKLTVWQFARQGLLVSLSTDHQYQFHDMYHDITTPHATQPARMATLCAQHAQAPEDTTRDLLG
ncbi:hypothetical protein PtrSN002B_009614 [Pyrenophora tritici-repentis]|uniref:Uncharacterized protein n=1 Tax=Pyrenophora tritici-repentis TaxID=45151 RepID=A0A2W1DC32_9PLEO|nr:hypothetical protein PtrV1_02678 [Pyrenophora tritici-repentis]KAG9389184.1 hypothetical protein A1F94_002077 [Pyrenophora tritici-repentis]KAI1517697.1 hypothetical protein Ptr86124_002998 [Pyrenophora tritici-repentis]KAI1527394.1 hypothetical protein PtrSN001A_009477 [Pyrenophora tritici-repentis]KAI1528531.1 hypothetical protein PtrSN001C_009448 [Pyrenophora tritici-repentis]